MQKRKRLNTFESRNITSIAHHFGKSDASVSYPSRCVSAKWLISHWLTGQLIIKLLKSDVWYAVYRRVFKMLNISLCFRALEGIGRLWLLNLAWDFGNNVNVESLNVALNYGHGLNSSWWKMRCLEGPFFYEHSSRYGHKNLTIDDIFHKCPV